MPTVTETKPRAKNGDAFKYVQKTVPNFYMKPGRYAVPKAFGGATIYYALQRLKKENKQFKHVRLWRNPKGAEAKFVVRAADLKKAA